MPRKFIVTACFFICGAVAAQQYSFERFTIENGLSNNVVYATRQDSKGYLWVATHDGLNRYDGYEFRKYLHNPFDKKSLAGNMTIDMAEDDQGRQWVLTNTHLHLLDDKNGSFERYALPAGTINHSNQSASKMIDGNHRYLLFNLFNGMFVFDKKSRQFSPITVETTTAVNTDLFNFPFFKDQRGNILIGGSTSYGVFCFDSISLKFKRTLPPRYQNLQRRNEVVTSVFVNKKNVLVYCTQEDNKFFLETEKGKKHFLLTRSVLGSTVFIETVKEDQQGNIWIGYGNRLFQYLPDADSVIDASQNLYTTSLGKNFIVKDICIDNFSNLWIGLYEAGLLKASIRPSLFINFSISKNANYQLPYSSIYDLIKNPDETVLVRYFGTQMSSILDPVNKKLVQKEFKFNPLDTSVIKKLFPQFQTVKSAMPFYKYFDATSRLTFNNGQFGLYKDNQQDFWAVNFNEFRRIKDNRTYNIGDHINCFYEGDGHNFWIGSDGNGLIQLNYQTGRTKNFLPEESNRESISSKFVNVVIPDGRKGLWLGTRYGLNYFDLKTRKCRLYSEENGLCNNTIYTMEKDQHGKLWLGTSNGLSCYDTETNEFTNYSKSNGLVNSEYNRNGSVALSNGWILMGGTEGIDVIIPDSIKYRNELEKKFPPLQITVFKSPDSSFFSFTDPIRLKHDQNNIEISFTALDFTQPFHNKYLWILEPVDKKWIYGLGKHEVSYAGLPPGNYSFKLKAAGSDGVWSEEKTLISFTIIAPWWKSWWAITAAIVLVIGVLTGILRLYYHEKLKRQLRTQKIVLEKQQAVEKERTRIATDMHDDLGAGLSRIKYLSETIGIKKQQQQPIEEDVMKIRDYSTEMIDKMGEIVWALNEKNDSIHDLLSYTRSYGAEYLSQSGIHCKIDFPEYIPAGFVSGEFRRNVFLAVKEILHNVIKHSQAENVKMSIHLDQDLVIEIQDDGIGFERDDTMPYSNGLNNIEKRMKDIGGTVAIISSKGTSVTMKIPFIQ
ncbi:MAG: two-component regulator propeller domain-containing protein [Flavisolibacter sp.]